MIHTYNLHRDSYCNYNRNVLGMNHPVDLPSAPLAGLIPDSATSLMVGFRAHLARQMVKMSWEIHRNPHHLLQCRAPVFNH